MAGRRRLRSLDDICRFLADVVNRLESGQLDDAQAKSRAYLANILAGVIKSRVIDDVEERITALEEKIHGKSHDHRKTARLN